jgi:glycerophosphoryl diester phosphodiesterase
MPSHSQVERIGHRGAPRDCMENTLASFLRAVALGATGVELDVHVTADGVPVVHHDPELSAKVRPKNLARATLADLDSHEVASVRLSSGDRLPTLVDVLEAMTPATKVYVEIKGGSPAVIARVLAPFTASVAVHSFDHEAIAEMARIAPGIPRGILIEKSADEMETEARRTGATDVWPAHKLVDAEFMDRVRGWGARVIPWTVNSSREVRRLVGLGVAGICTNDLSLFGKTG